MFEKLQSKRKGNKLTFKFNSNEEILTFYEIIGIGMYIYALRNKPEFKILSLRFPAEAVIRLPSQSEMT